MSANIGAFDGFHGSSIGVEAAFMQAAPQFPGYGGSSIGVEAAFAGFAPAGGSLGVAPGGYGNSIGVEAAFAQELQGRGFHGSSLGVEAAFACYAPAGGSVNLPGYGSSIGVDPYFGMSPQGFYDGSSLAVEAAFMDPGPRRATGASCMVAAGASMNVEAAFAEYAPPHEAGSALFLGAPLPPPHQAPPSALAAMYAAAEARALAAASNAPREVEESSLRGGPSTPRRRPQPLPPAVPVQRSTIGQMVPGLAQMMQGLAQPVQRQAPFPAPAWPRQYASFRSPPSGQPPWAVQATSSANQPSWFPPQTAQAFSTHAAPSAPPQTAQAFSPYAAPSGQPSFAMSREVTAYPYMYHAPDLRYETPVMAQAVPAQAEVVPIPQRLSFEQPSGYMVASTFGGGDMPSYAPRAVSSRTEEAASASVTPVQGLSLRQVAPGQGVAYPGSTITRGNTLQFSSVPQAYAAQLPVQVDRHAAAASATLTATGPQRSQQAALLPFNGNAARFTQPAVSASAYAYPQSSSLSFSGLNFSAQAVPTATYLPPSAGYARPQVPSFIAPVTAGPPHAPTFILPQQQQVRAAAAFFPQAGMPFQFHA